MGSRGGAAEAAITDSMANDCNAIDVCWNSPDREDDISEDGVPRFEDEEESRRLDGDGEEDGKSELLNSDARVLPDVGEAETSSMTIDILAGRDCPYQPPINKSCRGRS